MKHTPTPWKSVGREIWVNTPEGERLLCRSEEEVLTSRGLNASKDMVIANAAFIVLCVNNFETVNLHFQRTHKALETLVRFCRENGMEVHQVAEAVEQLQLNEAVRLAATRG